MATHATRGKGTLYETHSGKVISMVSYHIHEELTSEGTLEKWWGELTLTDSVKVPDGDKYMIELEDKRKGNCSLKRRINRAVILVPPRYIYLIRGNGPMA
ncbi:hypothetical protein ACFLVS_01760 [Chloroflexota bacterium]